MITCHSYNVLYQRTVNATARQTAIPVIAQKPIYVTKRCRFAIHDCKAFNDNYGFSELQSQFHDTIANSTPKVLQSYCNGIMQKFIFYFSSPARDLKLYYT
ncbi:hypothetical protein T01_11386 [Trichinella spiralis]|uniref:Uncharacterized protein n=1 Tax=Trichinella spiralis TaxID=6334 RepID=A0A0V1B6Q7_TRISP|nr:hypothetical protein T01_11386 [Trichinella spiralis]